VAPAFLAARAKGRLQHAMRSAGLPTKFARNFAVRSIGDNTRETVAHYIHTQLERGEFADPGYRDRLERATWTDPTVDLAEHTSTSSGRYWYNLHLVMVTTHRYRIDARTTAAVICETCRAVAGKHGFQISALSVMPDHMHVALRGVPDQSPEDIVVSFQNNTAWKLGQVKIWEHNYYAGTVGEYTMRAVRDRD
jgi:putative transposase